MSHKFPAIPTLPTKVKKRYIMTDNSKPGTNPPALPPPLYMVQDIPDKLLQDLGLLPEDVGQESNTQDAPGYGLIVLFGLSALATTYLLLMLLASVSEAMITIP